MKLWRKRLGAHLWPLSCPDRKISSTVIHGRKCLMQQLLDSVSVWWKEGSGAAIETQNRECYLLVTECSVLYSTQLSLHRKMTQEKSWFSLLSFPRASLLSALWESSQMVKCIFIALPVCICHEISANKTTAFAKQTLKTEKKTLRAQVPQCNFWFIENKALHFAGTHNN